MNAYTSGPKIGTSDFYQITKLTNGYTVRIYEKEDETTFCKTYPEVLQFLCDHFSKLLNANSPDLQLKIKGELSKK